MDKYLKYTTSDFLKDPKFIQWQLFKSAEQDEFWTLLLESYPQLATKVEEASNLFKEGVRINIDRVIEDDEIDLLLSDFYTRIQSHRKPRFRMVAMLSVVASLAILLLSLWYLMDKNKISETPTNIVVADNPELDDIREVTLITGNSTIALGNNAAIQYNADGTATINNEEVDHKNVSEDKLAYNELIVPRGRQTSLTLGDGTKMWVNSGSKVRYPSSFGDTRRDIFVEGEVFLDVAKDKSRPFYVNTANFEVKVLGTSFNISAFSEDHNQSVVLVNGGVEVSVGARIVELKPSQMMSYENSVTNVQTVDVMDYVAWKNGWLQLNSMTLKELVAKLSRYYDRKISYDPAIGNLKCSGKLILFNDIETVLDVVRKNLKINYTVDNQEGIMLNL